MPNAAFVILNPEGINLFRHSALDAACPSRWLVSARESSFILWIPASSGMTKESGCRLSLDWVRGKSPGSQSSEA
ncbi:MAG: hypothetical protein NT056_00995 [Proteobacteria bacterium]|nr:hypothetical protein [Pseudomonadota bacterium]